MSIVCLILIYYLIFFHLYAFILEAFLWKKPFAMKSFGTNPETAKSSYTLAINQGIYNTFISAGLIWSLFAVDPIRFQIQVFFLSCITIAGVTGGLTSSKKIMLLQALPALIALLLVLIR